MNEFERQRPQVIQNPERKISADVISISNNTEARSAKTTDGSAGPARLLSQIAQAIHDFDKGDDERAQQEIQQQQVVVEMLMQNANILIEAKEHRLALNILRNVLMRNPEHREGLRRMGLSLREEGRFEEALKCFRALAKTEQKHEAQILIAETLYLGERDDMSLAAYREVLKSPVSDKMRLFDIYKNIGNIHVRAGDYELAEEFYNKAYVLKSDSDVLMVNYGTLEIQRENFAEAVLRFRTSVEINPNNDKGWVGLSLVHRQMGDHELAWANVQRALDINRINRTAIRLVVDWGSADQDFTVAIARLQEYLEAEGEDAEMSYTLARIFTHNGRVSEARIEMERVLALDPSMQGAEALKVALDREVIARAAALSNSSTAPKAGVV